MNVLVIGVQGQVARALAEARMGFSDLELQFVGRPQLDLSVPGLAARTIRELRPDVVVNAAAYTAVDQAEREPDLAFAINATAAIELASASADVGASLIQLSTDYVFGGDASTPYHEDAPTGPINVYGHSKLAGEEAVRASNPKHLIIRTSRVFSPIGSNFVKAMLRLAEDQNEVRVVSDQFGCPTSARGLAEAIGEVLYRWKHGGSHGQGQTYHVTGAGTCNWAQFAAEIFAASAELGGPTAKVVPILTAEFPTPAARPKYSVLDGAKFAAAFGVALPSWQSEVRRTVSALVANK